MILRFPYPFLLLILISLPALEGGRHDHSADSDALDIDSRLELFVDDYLIDSLTGLKLKLHTPRRAGKVMVFDRPWEGVTSGSTAVVFQDGDLYRMYYRGSSHAGYAVEPLLEPGEVVIPEHPYTACYAESRDGIHWTRPSLGIIEYEGSRDNNIVWMGKGTGAFLPFKDSNPNAPASELYKAVGPDSRKLYAFISPDGIHWKEMREDPIITDGAFDSPNLAFWDQVHERYVAVYRDFTMGVRTIKIATSTDFRNWTPGRYGDFGDAPAEHLYTNATQPYFRAPHIYLAFPRRFHPWKTRVPFDQANSGGCSDAIFMSSRDAIHWNRQLDAFIRPGKEIRNWSHRSNTPAWGLLATAPDEISLYVQRHYTFPTNYLERMVIRTDGFMSVHARPVGRRTDHPASDVSGREPGVELRDFGGWEHSGGDPGRRGTAPGRVRSGGVSADLGRRDRAHDQVETKSRPGGHVQAPGASLGETGAVALRDEGRGPLLAAVPVTSRRSATIAFSEGTDRGGVGHRSGVGRLPGPRPREREAGGERTGRSQPAARV